VLFAPDVVTFVLGARWLGAVRLLQGLAITGAIYQLGFNWFSFYRARGQTGPPAVESVVGAAAFCALAVPGLLLDGATGFVVGRILGTMISTAVRWAYVRRLLPGVRLWPLVGPALLPLAPAVAAVLVVRLAAWGGHRSLPQAIGELLLFIAVYGALVLRRERALIDELRTAIR
jgi:O-antigen/teichoic acid export membrane protein